MGGTKNGRSQGHENGVNNHTQKPLKTGWLDWETVHSRLLPPFLRDNEYLIDFHRPQLFSAKQCFTSLFRIHTETGNIWSHLIGKILC